MLFGCGLKVEGSDFALIGGRVPGETAIAWLMEYAISTAPPARRLMIIGKSAGLFMASAWGRQQLPKTTAVVTAIAFVL